MAGLQKTERQQNDGQQESGSSWMLTFADLLSLLLAFFVLLFSMSTLEIENWKSVVTTFTEEFNPSDQDLTVSEESSPDQVNTQTGSGLNLQYLTALLSNSLKSNERLSDIAVNRVNDRIVLSISALKFFGVKNTNLNTSAESDIRQLIEPLLQIRNPIIIASHTDRSDVRDTRFRSNWELSMMRGRIVAGIMADNGYRRAVTILSYADTKFHELSDELELQEQYDLAERIDIIILDEQGERGPYDIF